VGVLCDASPAPCEEARAAAAIVAASSAALAAAAAVAAAAAAASAAALAAAAVAVALASAAAAAAITETGEAGVGVVLKVFNAAPDEDAGLETCWEDVGVAAQAWTSAAGLGGMHLREASPVTEVRFAPMVLNRLLLGPKSAGGTLVAKRWEASLVAAGKA